MKTLIFLFLMIPGCTFGQAFTQLNHSFNEKGEGGIDWGDLDKDGDLDFVISGFDAKVYINNNGTFAAGQRLTFTDNGSPRDNLNHGNVQLADLNNDGNLDILVSGWTGASETTRVFINSGTGSFPVNFPLATANGRYSIAKDLNNDNLLDIIHVGYNSVKVFRNNGALKFDLVFVESVPVSDNYFVDAGDMDNNGTIDLFLTTMEQFVIYKNEGQFTFSHVNNHGFPWLDDEGSISALDYNNDGLVDLVITGLAASAPPIYYNNESTFKLDSSNISVENLIRGSMDWGDCDHDGDLDLLVTGLRSGGLITRVYVNENGVFKKNPSVLAGTIYGDVKWGDHDNDGDLDILLWGSEQLKIYRNDLATTGFVKNSAPSPPQDLSFTQRRDTVVLRWAPGNDNETPPAGLSYNVWIKKGDQLVVSANADMTNGKLLFSGFGNAFSNKEFKIRGLEIGQSYEWGVQSIDGGFLSSGFATSSFTYHEPIVGTAESQSAEIGVYPNPTIGPLHVTSPTSGKIRFILIDNKGMKLVPTAVSNNLLDLKDFARGTYILNVLDGNQVRSFKIIKD